MKSKITIYVLLTLSILIWGIIIWKLVYAFENKTPEIKIHTKVTPAKKDSVSLILNYRDPFSGNLPNHFKQDTALSRIKNDLAVPEIVPDFKYRGTIKMNKTLFILLNKNGQEIIIKPDDKIGEFSILQVASDKLLVKRKGKVYELSIE